MPDVIDIRTGKPIEQEKKPIKKKPSLKKIAAAAGVVIALIVWVFIFVQQEQTLNAQSAEMAYLEDVRRSKEESIAAKREQLNLQSGNSFIEAVAREKLNYIKKNEIVFLPVK